MDGIIILKWILGKDSVYPSEVQKFSIFFFVISVIHWILRFFIALTNLLLQS
jgi:hypothetical protein